MDLKKFVIGDIENNCYLLTSAGEALVVDPTGESKELLAALEESKAFLRYILLTHGHYDHVLGVDWLKAKYPKANVIIGEDDISLLHLLREQGFYVGEILPKVHSEVVAVTEGSALPFGDEVIKVIASPGHTKGSVCYEIDGLLFSGDTLFYHTYGRIDLPFSEPGEMKESLGRLFGLDGKLRVLPGHGKETTIKEEKEFYG